MTQRAFVGVASQPSSYMTLNDGCLGTKIEMLEVLVREGGGREERGGGKREGEGRERGRVLVIASGVFSVSLYLSSCTASSKCLNSDGC